MYNLVATQDATASCSEGTSLLRCEGRCEARCDADLVHNNWNAAHGNCIMAGYNYEDEVI